METDADLKRDVLAELAWDGVDARAVTVTVKEGVVTLTGRLDTYPEKRALERALQRINGARAVHLDLAVCLSPELQRSDADIAEAAEAVLQEQLPALADALHLSVEHGWLTVEGDVQRAQQRQRVEEALRDLTGLVGLTLRIALRRNTAVAYGAPRMQHVMGRY